MALAKLDLTLVLPHAFNPSAGRPRQASQGYTQRNCYVSENKQTRNTRKTILVLRDWRESSGFRAQAALLEDQVQFSALHAAHKHS